MAKFISTFLLFFLAAFLFYATVLFIWGASTDPKIKSNLDYNLGGKGHSFSRFKEIQHISNVDVLFLGSSHAFKSFDTRIFDSAGKTSFNLGTINQTPVQTTVLINRYLKKLGPKLIVFEVYPYTFSIDGVESTLDLIANSDIDARLVRMAFNTKNIKVLNTLLYRTLRDLLHLDKNYIEPIKNYNETYVKGGYSENDLVYHKMVHYPKQTYHFYDYQFESFDKIMALLKSQGYEVVLVNAPMTKDLYDCYTNNNRFDSIMNKYGNYYNFNKIINLNDTLDFMDSNHLNQVGVEKFNDFLIKLLRQKYWIGQPG